MITGRPVVPEEEWIRTIFSSGAVISKQTEGIIVAEVSLGGDGELGDVLKAADIFGLEACFVKTLTIEGDVVIAALEALLQAGILQFSQRRAVYRFDFGLEKHDLTLLTILRGGYNRMICGFEYRQLFCCVCFGFLCAESGIQHTMIFYYTI